ncbi:unnamed protein product [Schistosoma margrebowiei]|uniref:Uncharacterized protein n=1 Tax=Schistosoma margrebowiei TaxID=48269 RepID=A0A183N7E6_9TREM|nr:unnamed protein product [Schistosoma margrebowiei]
MQFDDFHSLSPIYIHRLFLIFPSAETWFILFHSRLLLMVSSDQRTLSILRRQLCIHTCTFSMMIVLVFHTVELF